MKKKKKDKVVFTINDETASLKYNPYKIKESDRKIKPKEKK